MRTQTPLLASRPLAYVARISYGIYLWQAIFIEYTQTTPTWIRFPICLSGAVAAAAMSWWCVEQPASRWVRRKIRRAPSPQVVALPEDYQPPARQAPRK